MPKKVIQEIDYKIYYNKKNKQVVGHNQSGVACIYIADLDRNLPKLEKSVKGITVRKAKLTIYE